MKPFIDFNDINILCNDTKFDNRSNNKKGDGFNEQKDKQDESESQYNRSSTFKEKMKNIWGNVKRGIFVGVDILKTITTLAKAVIGLAKCFHKMKGAFA